MDPAWTPTADQVAEGLASLYIENDPHAHKLGQGNGWPGGAGNGSSGPTPPTTPHRSPDFVGWGGQAIPDSTGFRVPWFGRSRGKGGPAQSGRGRRGRGGVDRGGRRGFRRSWSGADQYGEGIEEGLSVEDVVNMCHSLAHNQPVPDRAYQALFHFDSRATALLLKDLSKAGLGYRAIEIFDWLRNLESGHPLAALCDVYTYTAMISMCIYQQDVDRAMDLAKEMRLRNVERNVHTYTALMNVCIKCGNCPLALDTYNHMRQDGTAPNVVTYNTLIDVYGKMGLWEQAVKVLTLMKSEGVEPVLRTYNTLIIACNMCGQPREAMAVYKRMLDEGYTPNATTYNALISAYGKAGQLDKVMEVFQEMVHKNCERSVITYSSLISACEKAGQWQLALELFNEMHAEGCVPNTVTFNSLITACAQGAQWEKAAEVFEEMQNQGCTPDVVTYTALISAYEKGGQWERALGTYEQMRAQRCKPDSIVFNAIIDTLWETGVIWAQRKALALFRQAVEEGHFKQQRWEGQAIQRAEVNLHAMTAGVAMLSLYSWLMGMRARLGAHGRGCLPLQLAIVTDKGKNSKEQGNLVVKEAVAAMTQGWHAPFRPAAENMLFSGMLEASGSAVEEWLLSPEFDAKLFSYFSCTDIMPDQGGTRGDMTVSASVSAALDDEDGSKELTVEMRCQDAFLAILHFERTHCLTLQNMGFLYQQRRLELVHRLLNLGARLGLVDDYAHDAVLLMDRTMSTSLQVKDDLLELLAVACLMIAAKQGERTSAVPSDAKIEHVTGMQVGLIQQMEWNVRRVLGNDTAAISTLRCLKLYLERMGCNYLQQETLQSVAGSSFALVTESLTDMAFLNCRPSVIAAAVIYAERRGRGIIPFWPSMLAKLSGYQDMSTPELSVAIKAAQRLAARLAASAGPSPPRTPTAPGV